MFSAKAPFERGRSVRVKNAAYKRSILQVFLATTGAECRFGPGYLDRDYRAVRRLLLDITYDRLYWEEIANEV